MEATCLRVGRRAQARKPQRLISALVIIGDVVSRRFVSRQVVYGGPLCEPDACPRTAVPPPLAARSPAQAAQDWGVVTPLACVVSPSMVLQVCTCVNG